MVITQRVTSSPSINVVEHTDVPTDELDALVAELHVTKRHWALVPPRERAQMLERIMRDTMAVCDEWVAAACAAKGYQLNSAEGAEEMIGGIGPFVRMARCFRTSLLDIAENARPLYPGPVEHKSNDRLAIRVVPASVFDRIVYAGITAEVWMPEGLTEAQVQAEQAAAYRDPVAHEGVALVLGAGNVASLAPRDVLTKLFAEGKVVVLKANPVNDYLIPFWSTALSVLIEGGFLRIVRGGAAVGTYLAQHSLVDEIHITGSDKTHDAVVFGGGIDGEQRKAANQPVVTKPVSCELGNVSPVVIVPGKWSAAEIHYQAEHVATMFTNNAGFNCLTPRVIVTHEGWAQRDEFFGALTAVLAELPTRRAYYPGARERHANFLSSHPHADQIGHAGGDRLPWTIVRDVDATRPDEICFNVEAFCSLMCETALEAGSPAEFVERAVTFCNDSLWGTLSMTLLAHPDSLVDPVTGAAIDQAIGDLRYGAIGVNIWHAMSFVFSTTTWGAYPGHPITNIQSGTGVVGNSYLFARPQKSVVRGPFISRPTPAWFATKANVSLAHKALAFESDPSWRRVPGLLIAALAK